MKNSGGSGARTSGPQSADLWSDDCNVVAPHWSPDEDVQRLRTGGPRSEVRHPEGGVLGFQIFPRQPCIIDQRAEKSLTQCASSVDRHRHASAVAMNHDDVAARLPIDFESVATKKS